MQCFSPILVYLPGEHAAMLCPSNISSTCVFPALGGNCKGPVAIDVALHKCTSKSGFAQYSSECAVTVRVVVQEPL